MKVRLSREARAYIREETQYLAARSRLAAENFLARMWEAQTTLSRFPDIGVGRESLPIASARRLITGPYLIDYQVREEILYVNAIRHARQGPQTDPAEDDFNYET